MDDIMKALIGLGPGGIVAATFAFLWKQERDERRDLATQNTQLLRDTLTSQHALADSIDKLSDRVIK